MDETNKLLRDIPQVDEILNSKFMLTTIDQYPHSIIVDSIREELNILRSNLLSKKIDKIPNIEQITDMVINIVKNKSDMSLKKVINATGVTLHTNFGRSLLSKKAIDYIVEIANNYTNLEYNIEKGSRGHRITHIEKIICDITGKESCLVVNNNAAATMLVLAAISKDKEVIVSRGELIEIGGSFRIPEVMSQSGAILKEVGTTNKTKISDYENAYKQDMTGALLKVHTSNYKILGFTEEVNTNELVALGKKLNVPVIYDLGSGLFVNLKSIGIDEPTIKEIVNTGIDIVMFSGDKLLGGPQAGIIVGNKKYIELMKKHPLYRILRVDKLTIAALYATLYEYYDNKKAICNIPTLKMLTLSKNDLKNKCDNLIGLLNNQLKNIKLDIEECLDQVGGGSAPLVNLDGYAIVVHFAKPAEYIEEFFRKQNIPIVCRINNDRVLLSIRCIDEKDYNYIVSVFKSLDEIEV